MAQTVKIISDSTCDLSKELVEKYDITILPLHILLGEDEYRDGVDITPEEIFRWSAPADQYCPLSPAETRHHSLG